MLLAPALLAAPAPAVKGPAVEGWVYNEAGKPLQATVGLIPMSTRASSLALKSVESLGVPSKKKPGFKLPIPRAGLYLLDVRAKGHVTLQIPILLTEESVAGMDLMPHPESPRAS